MKLYLFHDEDCVEKQKTKMSHCTLNPSYEETLRFSADYAGSILRVTVWGDYGKLNRKIFMGIAQIVLDEIKLTNYVEGWYKLYSLTSVVSNLTMGDALLEKKVPYLNM